MSDDFESVALAWMRACDEKLDHLGVVGADLKADLTIAMTNLVLRVSQLEEKTAPPGWGHAVMHLDIAELQRRVDRLEARR